MLPEFVPSKMTYIRPRQKKYPNGTGFINDQKALSLFKEVYHANSRKEVCKIVGCKGSTYTTISKKLGLSKEKARPHSYRPIWGLMMEDYFYLSMSILEIAKKYNCSHTTVSLWLNKMFYLKESDDTTIIVRQSKMNDGKDIVTP